MADKTISELVAASEVTPLDLFVLEQNATAKKLTGQVLENWLVSFADGHGGIQTIAKTGTSGLVDTYTITYADTTTNIFTVTNGEKGDTGDAWYMHIKYSAVQPTSDADMGNSPDKWIGIYSGTSSSAPTHYTSYTWYQYKGEKGDTGNPATLSSQEIKYGVGSNGTTPPSSWQDNIPTTVQGEYLWTRVTLTFNTGSPVVYYLTAYHPEDGTGTGDMKKSDYDSFNTVLTSGGITNYVNGVVSPISQAVGSLNSDVATLKNTTSFTVTLAANGWNNKQQSVTNNNFAVSGYAYTITPAPTSFKAYGQAQIYADDITLASHCTFHCENVPTEDITVNVMRVVVN